MDSLRVSAGAAADRSSRCDAGGRRTPSNATRATARRVGPAEEETPNEPRAEFSGDAKAQTPDSAQAPEGASASADRPAPREPRGVVARERARQFTAAAKAAQSRQLVPPVPLSPTPAPSPEHCEPRPRGPPDDAKARPPLPGKPPPRGAADQRRQDDVPFAEIARGEFTPRDPRNYGQPNSARRLRAIAAALCAQKMGGFIDEPLEGEFLREASYRRDVTTSGDARVRMANRRAALNEVGRY